MAENPLYTIDGPTTVKENLITKTKGNFDDLYTKVCPTALKGSQTDAAVRFNLEHEATGAHTTDVISEKTLNAGVTIDGIKCKDLVIYTDGVTEKTGSNDVPFLVPIQVDIIKEKTSTVGVTIDSALCKDGDFVANSGTITSFKSAAAEIVTARGSMASLDARLDVSLEENGNPKAFPAGTKIPFYNVSVPTGWTQDIANNDALLRVVAATGGGFGGAHSPVYWPTTHSHTTGNLTLTIDQIPSHGHSYSGRLGSAGEGSLNGTGTGTSSYTTGNTGGGAVHNHGITSSIDLTFVPKYVDLIIGIKS